MSAEHGLPSGYARYFEELGGWGRTRDSVSAGERSRIDALLALVPDDVESVIDVGCGDGLLTNEIAKHVPAVTGVDLAAEALRHVQGETIQAACDAIPVPDRAFDLAVAADVLEHLPEGTFERTCAELDRVARRYLLLNSPHAEDLVLAQTRCGRCKATFHASRHVRSITLDDVREWFPGFDVRDLRFVGEPWPRRSRRLQRLAQLVGNVWYRDEAVCPNCGYRVDPPRPSPIVRAVNGVVQVTLGKLRGSRSSELVVLLERRD